VASLQDQEATPPTNMANVTPMDSGTAQTRQIVEAVKASVSGLASDVKEIRNYRYTDLLLHIGAFAGGIIIVVTLVLNVYSRLDDKIQNLSTTSTRVDTKLEDLLQRIPPVPTSPARK
jgi:hypothetical protein